MKKREWRKLNVYAKERMIHAKYKRICINYCVQVWRDGYGPTTTIIFIFQLHQAAGNVERPKPVNLLLLHHWQQLLGLLCPEKWSLHNNKGVGLGWNVQERYLYQLVKLVHKFLCSSEETFDA